MNCPACNIVCVENANFCHMCGSPLTERAKDQKDQTVSLTDAIKRLMPSSYIDKLLASNGTSEGERRVVTILFSDVKGSTEIGENLDPEDVLNLMNEAFEVLIQPIMKYEGTLARLMGDAILAFFGAPIAHEDDPHRACRAALEIISGAEKLSKRLEKEKGIKGFSVRVGINTGLVVVAEVGADYRVEYTAMGDAVNVASRMESAAEQGTILITGETKKLVDNKFQLEPVGAIQAKGKKNPINAYRLINEVSEQETQHSNTVPLIGRKEEVNEILEIIKRSQEEKKGCILSLIGEGGIGKTRLISEIKRIKKDDVNWIEVKSLAYQQNNSYWLIKGLLKNHLIGDNGKEPNLKVLLKRKLAVTEKKKSEIYHVISYLLGLEQEELLPFPFEKDAETLRGQIHYSVKEYFKNQTYKKPLVLLLEDLQWCDIQSLELLTELFSLADKIPIIMINTFRKGNSLLLNIHERLKELYAHTYAGIHLDILDSDSSRELIKEYCEPHSLPLKVEGEIIKRAGGNPFFIEQIIRSYIELREKSNGSNIEPEIPGLLHSVIMSRLDYLPLSDKTILQTASVVGRLFSKGVLQNLLPDLTGEQLEKSLNQLVHKEFISLREKEYIFNQSLIQEVAYSSLLISIREKTHLAAGEYLEKHSLNPQEDAATLAPHFDKGKNYKKAIHYYKTAADKAKGIFAANQALLFYERITELAELSVIDQKSLLGEVYESLGDVYQLISDYPKALENYSKAADIITDEISKGIIDQKKGQVYEKWGHYESALSSYDLSLAKGIAKQDTAYKARTLNGKAMVYYREGAIDKAVELSLEALNFLDETADALQFSECCNNLGIFFSRLSKPESALKYLFKAIEIRTKLNHLSGLAASYNNLGFLYQLTGENIKAADYYLKSLEFCERTGNLHGLAKIYDNLSEIYIETDEREKALSYNLLAMEILGKLAFKSKEFNQMLWMQTGVW